MGITKKVNRDPVNSTSKRQTLFTLNSTEDEYAALSNCTKQTVLANKFVCREDKTRRARKANGMSATTLILTALLP